MSKLKTMRRIKIGEGFRKRKYHQSTLYPVLRIEGVWLQDAGFLAGSNVYVFVENGKIVIKAEAETVIKERA